MKLTTEQLNELLNKPAIAARNPGIGPRAQLQERKDADTGEADNKAGKAKVDGAVHPSFRVTITARISDNRRRDLDGAASTILDSLVSAIGRLAPVDSGIDRESAGGGKG